jgi:hypothetical protein
LAVLVRRRVVLATGGWARVAALPDLTLLEALAFVAVALFAVDFAVVLARGFVPVFALFFALVFARDDAAGRAFVVPDA